MRVRGYIIIALAVAGLSACSKPADNTADAGGTTAPSAPAAPEPSAAEKQAAIAALPAPYNTGDYLNGKSKFALCSSCHTIKEGGPNMTGPNLHGVFGRKAAGLEGYNYSDAMKAAGFVWDGARLDAWLANPRTYMPGTKMSFLGIKDAKDRTDVIAYLKVESGYKPAQ